MLRSVNFNHTFTSSKKHISKNQIAFKISHRIKRNHRVNEFQNQVKLKKQLLNNSENDKTIKIHKIQIQIQTNEIEIEIRDSTYHQNEKQQSAHTQHTQSHYQQKQIPYTNTIYIYIERESTGSVCLNGVHEIGVPEIPVVLADLHLVHVLLRRHFRTIFCSRSRSESQGNETLA